MKKNGFTLVELLAVITILAVILTITIPILLKVIKNSKETARKDSVIIYGKAVENAVAAYYTKYPDKNTVTLQELKQQELLEYKGKNVQCEEIQILRRNVYLSKCKVGDKKVDTTYGKYTPEVELTEGLTPVEYDGNNWVVTDPNTEWYNYNNQKWANAVTLLPGVKKEIGEEVKVDGTEVSMMLVWVPRYEYKIEGEFGKGGTSAALPGEIEVNFIGKNKTMPTEGYHIHPAFTFGTEEKSGMWVGKFELSHTEKSLGNGTTPSAYNASNLNCTTDTCIETQYLRILPNVPSLRYNDVSNFFYAIKGISNSFGLSSTDTHMMKNSEWGAVAYLSQSKYGKYGNEDYENKYKEVYQNKSENYTTGSSNGTPSQSGTRSGGQCSYNDMQDLGKDTNNYKMGQCGPAASTTGNIYGVYDMSGGSWEYVMGAYAENGYLKISSSGFSPDPNVFTSGTIESKYYDIYKTSTANTACGENEVCYGDGLSETSGWYGDYASMVTSSNPWFLRGGSCNHTSDAGVFYFTNFTGHSGNSLSARVVGFAK